MIQAIIKHIESKGFKVALHDLDDAPSMGLYLANSTKHTRSGGRGIACSVADPNSLHMRVMNLNGLKVRLARMTLISPPDVPVEKRKYEYDFTKCSLSDPGFFEKVDRWLR